MLQFITHSNDRYDHYTAAQAALEGGCRWVQLRMKDSPLAEIEAMGVRLSALCKSYDATFIIDDHVELVKPTDADGVHLGKNDMRPDEARTLLGEHAIIGGTANTFADIVELHKQGVDYIGLGPYRFTATKKNLSQLLGIEGYREILAACRADGIELPIVAIGGIVCSDIADILASGVTGIALSGTILNASSPQAETAAVLQEIDKYKI